MRVAARGVLIALSIVTFPVSLISQGQPKTLVSVWAHADDEIAASPVMARYAREGVRVFMIVVTDGAQGGAKTSIPVGPELGKARADEARCAAAALGAQPPVLLGFPDAELGSYRADPSRLYQVTSRIAAELERLRPDAIITWGPDGGTGHPDHRLVSSIVTQLVRAGAPGASERLFYASLPVEGFAVVNPGRGAPPFVVPQSKLFNVRVPFADADLEASRRAMACHKTQYADDTVQRVSEAMKAAFKGVLPFTRPFSMEASSDLFR
jgi:LmbE family N-acetylglucosaminyl deacetylase